MDSAVNTVADPNEIRGKAYSDIFALVNRASFIDGRNHDSAVIAITNLHKLDIGVNINVRVLTPLDPDILILDCGLFDCDAFIQSVHVHDLSFGLMRRYYLTEPIYDHIHVDFHRVAASLEKWSQSGKLE